MYKKGDILKMIDPCLSLRQDVQEWKDSTGRTHWVYWNETRKLYVGRQCEVEKVDGDFLHVNFYIPDDLDPWNMVKVTFLMHQEWFVNPMVEPPKCTCDIMVLMSSGCKCGQMKREKGNA
jgi:hypothetical protein